jgi:hypothetical protein
MDIISGCCMSHSSMMLKFNLLPWGIHSSPPSLLYNGYCVSFPGAKQPKHGFDHRPPSSAKLKVKSTATHLFPLWAFVACCRVNFTFGYLLPWGTEGGKQNRHLETAYYYGDSIQSATCHVMNVQYSSNTVINYST